MPTSVLTTGPFDDLRSRHLRCLQEAAKSGEVTVLLWPDETVRALTSTPPKFPYAERLYLVSSLRYVRRVVQLRVEERARTSHPSGGEPGPQFQLPAPSLVRELHADIWIDFESEANATRRDFFRRLGLDYRVIGPEQLAGLPAPAPLPPGGARKVIVTGCYDWLHSGHVRFFEEVSTYGDLYVVVGHDANIRLLKGDGHPLLPEAERRYQVASVRFVTQALISSGHGWLDAEPEIQRLKPDIYAVNEEGDRGGKREYCAQHGIEYLVLKRVPAPGLAARTSTELRGF